MENNIRIIKKENEWKSKLNRKGRWKKRKIITKSIRRSKV